MGEGDVPHRFDDSLSDPDPVGKLIPSIDARAELPELEPREPGPPMIPPPLGVVPGAATKRTPLELRPFAQRPLGLMTGSPPIGFEFHLSFPLPIAAPLPIADVKPEDLRGPLKTSPPRPPSPSFAGSKKFLGPDVSPSTPLSIETTAPPIEPGPGVPGAAIMAPPINETPVSG